MKLPVIVILSSMLLAGYVLGMHSSKSMEGYSSGLLSNCPGSTKPAVIKKKTLKYLTLTVQAAGNAIFARRTRYNYFQMKYLAKDPDIDFTKKTFLYVGGYMDSPGYPIAWILGKLYKDLGYNVLFLDTNLFTARIYPVAVRYMRPVGKHAAEMLANLTTLGLNPKTLEVIGLSLGGQTMSFIAKNYRLQTGLNISRLTGLDPSGPCFRNLGPEDRLDESDADFVDVVYTNIDGFGMAAPVGHVNFYVNGGEYQANIIPWIPCTILCSHIRSLTLWIVALLNSNAFIAMQCESVQQARDHKCFGKTPTVTNILGVKTDRCKKGVFYLATYNTFPFFMGEKGLKIENGYLESQLKELNSADLIEL